MARDLIGHPAPFFAPSAAVLTLGVSLGVHRRRVVELVAGVSLGVLVGDLLIAAIGTGPWQIALVVALAATAAVFFDGASLVVTQAGTSAVLVATILPPGGTDGFDRCIDALVGGAVGLLVAGLLPSHPLAPVRRKATAVLDELAAVLAAVADALRTRDSDAALAALLRARATQPLLDDLRSALASGREVVSTAPLRRPHRRALAGLAELAERSDYAMRNARVLARRVLTALDDDEPHVDALPDTISGLSTAVQRLLAELGPDGDPVRARAAVVDVMRLGEPPADELGPSEQVMLAQVRSIAVDLLQATGLTRPEALTVVRTAH